MFSLGGQVSGHMNGEGGLSAFTSVLRGEDYGLRSEKPVEAGGLGALFFDEDELHVVLPVEVKPFNALGFLQFSEAVSFYELVSDVDAGRVLFGGGYEEKRKHPLRRLDEEGEEASLKVHPVFSLKPDDGMGAVHNFVDYLFTSVSWQAVHEKATGFGVFKKLGSYLIFR